MAFPSCKTRHPYPLKKRFHTAGVNGKRIERVIEAEAFVAGQAVLGGYPDEAPEYSGRAVPALQHVENHALQEAVIDGEQGDRGLRLRSKAAGTEE